MAQSAKWDRHDGPGWRQRAAAYRDVAATLGPASKERMLAIAASYEEKAAQAQREHQGTLAEPRLKSRRKRGTRSEARS